MALGRLLRPEQHPALADVQEGPRRAPRLAAEGAPKPLITPIFPDFFRFFPVFPWTSGRVLWIPGVQTEKMGEKWGKMGKKWVKNEVTGVQKTVLMLSLIHISEPTRPY